MHKGLLNRRPRVLSLGGRPGIFMSVTPVVMKTLKRDQTVAFVYFSSSSLFGRLCKILPLTGMNFVSDSL